MRRGLAAALLVLSAATAAEAQSRTPETNYLLHCSGCHRPSGVGAPEAGVPAFPDSVGKIAANDLGRTYMMHVPGVISNSLGDFEIAAVMNYILDAWGGGGKPFTAEEVTRRRAVPVESVVALRREVAETLAASGITIAEYPWP